MEILRNRIKIKIKKKQMCQYKITTFKHILKGDKVKNIDIVQNLYKKQVKKIAISAPRKVADQIKKENISNQESDFILNEGFKFNLHYLKNYYFLQIQTCCRVIEKKTLKEKINQIKQKQNLNQIFIGKEVSSNYNSNYKSYPILGIDFSKNPQSKFEFKNKKQNTYVEFYKNNYKITIEDQSQPLVKVILKNFKDKDSQCGYMVPELMSLSAKKEMHKNNIGFNNQLVKIKKISQQQKIMSEKRIVQKINSNNKYLKINNSLHLDGYILKKVIICLKDKQISCNESGKIQQLNSLYQTPRLIKFALIYSQNGKNDRQVTDILNEMIHAASIFGIKLQPTHLKIKQKSESKQWIDSIGKRYDYKTVPQIFVFIFQQFEQSFYSKIKTFTINKLQCVSQMIRTRNFIKNKKKAAAASKIIIQICAKMDFMPWKVKPQHPYFNNKNFIYGALSMCKGKNGQFLSFVGTSNNECTRFYNSIKKINENNSQISHDILEQIFIEWIKSYYQENKQVLPDSILIYRKGLKQTQAKQHFNKCEIKSMQNSILAMKKWSKRQKYSPGYQFILVEQKSKTRFNYFQNSKWAKKQKNPLPGSVITFSSLEENFQMISKYSPNGVQYPVKYKGGYGQPNIPAEALIMFTWQQCHNYYNKQGSIRVPACIQYSKKLLNFASNQMDQIIQEGQQTKTRLFYL